MGGRLRGHRLLISYLTDGVRICSSSSSRSRLHLQAACCRVALAAVPTAAVERWLSHSNSLLPSHAC